MRRLRGFSLLEVMVAVALLALGLTVLFLAQARSLELARQAHNLSVATGLARMQLQECEQDLRKKGFQATGDYEDEGNFDEDGHPEFFWECHGYRPDIPVGEVGDIQQGLLAAGDATGSGGGLAEAVGSTGEGNPMAEMGAGAIAPVLSQISSVLGDSMRELIVIVRWDDNGTWMDMRVTTHLIDLAGMQAVAGQVRQATDLLDQFGGGGGGSSSSDDPGKDRRTTTPPVSNPFSGGGK